MGFCGEVFGKLFSQAMSKSPGQLTSSIGLPKEPLLRQNGRNMEKKQMKIAIVGASAAGKSAFIRSFSDSSGLINSVGDGQTTRCYTEYEFLMDGETRSEVEARIVSRKEFGERRASRAIKQLLEDYPASPTGTGIREWVRQELCEPVCEDSIKEILLHDKALFRIEEFVFLDEGIESHAGEEFERFQQGIMHDGEECREGQEEEGEEKSGQEEWLFEELCGFYEKIYDLIINALKGSYHEAPFFSEGESDMRFYFPISEEKSKLLSRLLKVDEEGNSLTGILSRVRVVSRLNEKYRDCIKRTNPDLESVTLIDTYGLDHGEVAGREVLEKRYDDMLNRDYPDISAVFFVARLTHSAPSDFREGLWTLYRTRPDIMAYVVGTHIDENLTGECDEEVKNWLYSGDKTKYRASHLQGKIWEELEGGKKLIASLYRKGVPETLARKRCEVMRRRFAPFCGVPDKQTGDIDYGLINTTSVMALFDSMALREYMGEGIISVAKIRNGISVQGIQEEFAERFIEEARSQFKELYIKTWSRTRRKVRENLESYIMGFNGSTVNATWGNAFRNAFWQVFSLEGGRRMLSDALEMEEAEKVAFDEILNQAHEKMLHPACREGVGNYNAYYCGPCGTEQRKVELCIWNSFMREAGFEEFRQWKRHSRIIDWLNALHAFLDDDGTLKKEIAGKIKAVLEEWVIPQCEAHNNKIIERNSGAENE